jgi:hypothetical protein
MHALYLSDRQRSVNAQMKRIDLICKLMGPLFIAFMGGISTEVAILVNLGMNLISVAIEYFAIAQVRLKFSSPLLPAGAKSALLGSITRFRSCNNLSTAAAMKSRLQTPQTRVASQTTAGTSAGGPRSSVPSPSLLQTSCTRSLFTRAMAIWCICLGGRSSWARTSGGSGQESKDSRELFQQLASSVPEIDRGIP